VAGWFSRAALERGGRARDDGQIGNRDRDAVGVVARRALRLNGLIRQSRGAAEAYDGITEVWWDKIEDLVGVLQTPEGQKINMLLAEDEGRFVDLKRSAVFFTEEHTIFDY
jgi:hypothetical protein